MITWIALRAAGIGAYVMLFGSVAWGLVGTTSVLGRRVAKATAVAIHQFLSTVGLALLGVHLVLLVFDRFVPFGPLDVLVPMRSSFRPVAVAFGVAAMYASVVVVASSLIRRRIGTKWWRRLHHLAAPAFILSMLHGIFTGTDTVRPWMWWTYASTGAIVLFLLLVRGLTAGLRPVRPNPPATERRRPRPGVTGAPVRGPVATPPLAAGPHAGGLPPRSRRAFRPYPRLPAAP